MTCDYDLYNHHMTSVIFLLHVMICVTIISYLFFFLIQQFITQCTVADHGSYFVTTYNRSRLHERKRKRKRKKDIELIEWVKKGKNKGIIWVNPKSIWNDRIRIVYEYESFWVSYQEHDKMTKWVSSRIPIPVIPHALIKNMSSWFDRIVTT